MSTCLIWTIGSRLILPNNQSNATLWVRDSWTSAFEDDMWAFRTSSAAQCDPGRQAVSDCSNSSKLNNLCSVSNKRTWIHEHCWSKIMQNLSKTVSMPRLTVWAQPPLITVLAHVSQFLPQTSCRPHPRAPTRCLGPPTSTSRSSLPTCALPDALGRNHHISPYLRPSFTFFTVRRSSSSSNELPSGV